MIFFIFFADMEFLCESSLFYFPCFFILSGKSDNVRQRTLTEEHARDSFENLLFSICRFRELTGVYPRNITVRSLLSFSLFQPSSMSHFDTHLLTTSANTSIAIT